MENNINASGTLLKTKSEFDISDSALGTLMFIVLTILFSIVFTKLSINITPNFYIITLNIRHKYNIYQKLFYHLLFQ